MEITPEHSPNFVLKTLNSFQVVGIFNWKNSLRNSLYKDFYTAFAFQQLLTGGMYVCLSVCLWHFLW